jgi:hypothetical protein
VSLVEGGAIFKQFGQFWKRQRTFQAIQLILMSTVVLLPATKVLNGMVLLKEAIRARRPVPKTLPGCDHADPHP